VLLSHAPDLVDHDTLLNKAWGRTALSPNVLPQAISELRQALGDSASKPQYIETLHRRGYRVVADVERIESEPVEKKSPSSPGTGRGRRLALIGLAVVVPLALALAWWLDTADRRWLDNEVIPAINELVETDVTAAWRMAYEARQRMGDDPRLEQLWLDLTLPVDLETEPPGALIEVSGYGEQSPGWVKLGRSPLKGQRLPLSVLRFRISMEGKVTVESAPSLLPRPDPFVLHSTEEATDGMGFVPPGPVAYQGERRTLPGFWISRHEVTNAEFRQFVEAGGYDDPEWWPDSVELEGQSLGRDALLALFVDQTGMPGPATWSLGTFPEGEDQHPVEGVSWFEASAYARWAGKTLPTVFHWSRAAGLGTPQAANFSEILGLSNFNNRHAVAVGSMGGLGPYGTYDMAGNVREWCSNSSGPLRYAMGAGWNENSYQFRDWVPFDPFLRKAGYGLRLISQDEPMAADLLAEVSLPPYTTSEPVDDSTFAIYASLYDYDATPLNAEVVEIDDSHADWRRERVEIDAAYADERIIVQLFLPRDAQPPYQTVLHFPGGDALMVRNSRNAGLLHVEPFLRTGRAVVYPVLKGMFERPAEVSGPLGLREQIIQQVKDIRRTLDYLSSRGDVDMNRLAFHGLSYGASRSMFALAVEPRFRIAMLVSTGISPTSQLPPEIQQVDYLARVRIPVLLVTGRNDFTFPYETTQKPFFEYLGTPMSDKRHVALDWGHLPPGYTELSRQLIDWSNQKLGPVELR
jgi:predicted esterase